MPDGRKSRMISFYYYFINMFAEGAAFYWAKRRSEWMYLHILCKQKLSDLLPCGHRTRTILLRIPHFQFSSNFWQSIFFTVTSLLCVPSLASPAHIQTEQNFKKRDCIHQSVGIFQRQRLEWATKRDGWNEKNVRENKALAKSKLENGKVYAYI